jgi:hypothetical protein
MISENSTPKTQARAFGYFSVAGNIGILVGPLIGMCDLGPNISTALTGSMKVAPYLSQPNSILLYSVVSSYLKIFLMH